ncbi:MAG TPA: protein-disulfide reductase DsbD [Steroidobacteraceae bacterium]|jgi:thiol:disulfide interchange protein DsbD
MIAHYRSLFRTLLVLGAVSGYLLLSPTISHAASSNDLDAVLDESHKASNNDDFLPPEKAFRLSASADGTGAAKLDWVIAPGYYLYRDRIKIADDSGRIGTPVFPDGQVKQDEYFGKQVVYHQELITSVPLVHGADGSPLALKVTYQGCAEAGLCYPPQTQTVNIRFDAAGGAGGTGTAAGTTAAATAAPSGESGVYVSEQNQLAALLESGSLLEVLLKFFVGGLLLAFTPCVLPMVPILSGLIVGQGQPVSTRRAFALSLIYMLGMSLTYTITGVAFAAAGKQVQAVFQQPWIIVLFAALFVTMAASMFGLFTLQMPSFIQTRVAGLSNRQEAGSFGGVAVMGALSALIVTTCVGPVLVAALLVISQTGDMLRGGAALFVMSLGMGVPLLIVGSSAGRWLPRAGVWMQGVKRLFGVLMLAMAAWMLARIVPDSATLLLYAVPVLAAAVVLWGFRTGVAWLPRGVAVLAALYGAALLFGAARGADDPLHPLLAADASRPALEFHTIGSVAELRREVQAAAAAHQAVMLDIDADWCSSCKEMQRYTFTDAQVRQQLQSVRLLRANVTANNADDQALLREFKIFGPPTIAFYDADGHEQQRYRVVGFMKAADFAALLQRAFASDQALAKS